MIYHKLLEISNNREQTLWLCATGLSDGVTTLDPGIWVYPVTIVGDPFGFDTSTIDNVRDYNTVRHTVNSVSVGTTDYTEVSDFADLQTQNQSFFFSEEDDSLRVYVHFDGLEPPNTFDSIFIGLTIPFSMTDAPGGYTSETGIFYAPRISSISDITQEVDPLFFGVVQNNTTTITLMNHENAALDDIGKSGGFALVVNEDNLDAVTTMLEAIREAEV